MHQPALEQPGHDTCAALPFRVALFRIEFPFTTAKSAKRLCKGQLIYLKPLPTMSNHAIVINVIYVFHR